MSHEIPDAVEVPLASLVELAIEWWRLERWLNSARSEVPHSHARHAARRLGKFLEGRELTVSDITGRGYEPGLAVEVLDVIEGGSAHGKAAAETIEEAAAETIEEMVAPIVMWRGAVVRYGQAIIKRGK